MPDRKKSTWLSQGERYCADRYPNDASSRTSRFLHGNVDQSPAEPNRPDQKFHTLTLLASGQVLVAGGYIYVSGVSQGPHQRRSYTIRTAWHGFLPGNMTVARRWHGDNPTEWTGGRSLVAGGPGLRAGNVWSSAELYSFPGFFSVFATERKPRAGCKFGPDGQLYVAEAGAGGTMSTDGTCDQVIPPVGPYLGGFTSRISKVASDGTVTTVADNLPSGINALGDVLGIADVAFFGRTLYALSSGGGCSHGFANDDAAILRVNPDGTTKSLADLSVFQKAHPVANPNPLDFEPDGSWYSMIALGNLLFAVEPNHGELDSIHATSGIRRIADISKSQGHSVPTAVASDGVNFFVGNLGTFPIVDGSQVILKITPSGRCGLCDRLHHDPGSSLR